MIRIDHVGIPAHVRLDAAHYLARILGLDPEVTDDGRFATVQVSSGFEVDLFDAPRIEPMQIAFVAEVPLSTTSSRTCTLRESRAGEPHDPANGRVDHPLAD